MNKKIREYFSPEQVMSRRLRSLAMYCAKNNYQCAHGLIMQLAREWDAGIEKRKELVINQTEGN